jgi:hypothetical protein
MNFHNHISEEAVYFFSLFSRSEFALKRGGFCKRAPGDKAEANWDDFANALGAGFLGAMQAAPQVRVLFDEPPRVLKVDAQGGVYFADQAAATNAAELFVVVRRVRNNLFHGEKANFTNRDELLVRAGIHVLEAALARCEHEPLRRVGTAFAYADLNQNP